MENEKYPSILGRIDATIRHLTESSERRISELELERKTLETRLDVISERVSQLESTLKTSVGFITVGISLIAVLVTFINR